MSSTSDDYLSTGSGKIMFLPEREVLGPGDAQIPSDADVPHFVYNHPVVVLSPREDERGEVDFVLLTSLGGADLRERYGEREFLWGSYLPIWPSNPHPDTQDLLHLTQESSMPDKESYVNISKSYTISMRHLRPLRVYKYGYNPEAECRLTEFSFNLMKKKISKGTVNCD